MKGRPGIESPASYHRPLQSREPSIQSSISAFSGVEPTKRPRAGDIVEPHLSIIFYDVSRRAGRYGSHYLDPLRTAFLHGRHARSPVGDPEEWCEVAFPASTGPAS